MFGNNLTKVGCIFSIVISSEYRMGKYRDDDHREDAPHFTTEPYGNLSDFSRKLDNSVIKSFYKIRVFPSAESVRPR